MNGEQYINKSANWSLRGDRRGFNNSPVVVFDRKLLEDDPHSVRKILKQQKEIIQKRKDKIELKIAPKNCNIRNWRENIRFKQKHNKNYLDSMPKRKALFIEYFEAGDQIQTIQSQLTELNEAMADPAKDFLTCFCDAAERELSSEEFLRIKQIASDNTR